MFFSMTIFFYDDIFFNYFEAKNTVNTFSDHRFYRMNRSIPVYRHISLKSPSASSGRFGVSLRKHIKNSRVINSARCDKRSAASSRTRRWKNGQPTLPFARNIIRPEDPSPTAKYGPSLILISIRVNSPRPMSMLIEFEKTNGCGCPKVITISWASIRNWLFNASWEWLE